MPNCYLTLSNCIQDTAYKIMYFIAASSVVCFSVFLAIFILSALLFCVPPLTFQPHHYYISARILAKRNE